MLKPPYPDLDDIYHDIGQAGHRLDKINACEGAAGNISVCLRWPVDPHKHFSLVGKIELTQTVPDLAGATILVSGSGCRLHEISDNPTANLACIVVDEGGQSGSIYTSPHKRFERVTSEFNSHLAVHNDQIASTGTDFDAIVHAQPVHLTFLSHIPRYQDQNYLNTHLLRWQPETIINLPEGMGFISFCIPSSPELMTANVECMQQHRLAIWAKHGVMARSDVSIMRATDLIEYAETAAWYEYLNLTIDEAGEGLSAEEIRSICEAFNIRQKIY
jgi:rhamnulose-1-phosphate aldolase